MVLSGNQWAAAHLREDRRIIDTESQKETFEGNGYVYYLDHGKNFMDIKVKKKTKTIHFKQVKFTVYQLYLNKVILKIKKNIFLQKTHQSLHCLLFWDF